MPDFFLDSCIFFAYAYPHEPWHVACSTFFNSRRKRFTGLRVKEEINIRMKRREKLYKDLAKYISDRGSPQEFISTVIKNKNDLRHFQDLLASVSNQSKIELVTYFRDKAEITKMGIADALTKVDADLIKRTDDPMFMAVIEAMITNRSDAQILVDALCWSETHPITFMTLDVTDVIGNRTHIVRAICNYKLVDPADLLLDIKHIGEI